MSCCGFPSGDINSLNRLLTRQASLYTGAETIPQGPIPSVLFKFLKPMLKSFPPITQHTAMLGIFPLERLSHSFLVPSLQARRPQQPIITVS